MNLPAFGKILPYIDNTLLSWIYRAVRKNYNIWVWIARNYNPIFDRIAQFNACSILDWSTLRVPAYNDYVKKQKAKINFFDFDTTQYPETSKNSYCKVYPINKRAKMGKLPLVGAMLDESSGSTGVPFNWIRSQKELHDIHTFSANYVRMAIVHDNLITLNAFSMGSWATGINTTLSLLRIGAVKSIGPDIDKIIDTLLLYGPGHNYMICGYPPFIKHLVDEMDQRNFPWHDYTMYAIVGGEGMTEALRDYLETKFKRVRSGYGATDLQLGVGGESDFTVWLRKELIKNEKLRHKLFGKNENRIPMIFHYNPLDHYIEINKNKEVVVTINNFALMSPRLRYNIEDEGAILKINEVIEVLKKHKYNWDQLKHQFNTQLVKLPMVCIFGRKDGTISYMGANIYPQDIEYGLYKSPFSKNIYAFCLKVDSSDNQKEGRPTIHVQLTQNTTISPQRTLEMTTSFQKGVIEYLASADKDFAAAQKEDVTTSDIRIILHPFDDDFFKQLNNKRIKNKYLA